MSDTGEVIKPQGAYNTWKALGRGATRSYVRLVLRARRQDLPLGAPEPPARAVRFVCASTVILSNGTGIASGHTKEGLMTITMPHAKDEVLGAEAASYEAFARSSFARDELQPELPEGA